MHSIYSVNPKEEISKLDIPVLIINDSCDIQVPTEHANELQTVTKNSQLVIIDNMGHALKELKNDCSNAMKA